MGLLDGMIGGMGWDGKGVDGCINIVFVCRFRVSAGRWRID